MNGADLSHPSPRSPTVSVIVPAYNSARFLPQALESVLGQTLSDLEVIVVDDGSVDSTPEVLAQWEARDPRVRSVRQVNLGLPSARNTGLRLARGEFIAFLDADDALAPEKFERQLAYLRAHPEVDLVYSDYATTDAELRPLTFEKAGPHQLTLREAYTYTNVFPVMSALLRRELVGRVGEFDPALKACEDWDYWVRCERAGTFGHLPGTFSYYRMHGSQMHRDLDFMLHYARMAAQKNFPGDRLAQRNMIGSILWWQFGLQMREERVNRWRALVTPRLLAKALRMVWEVRSVRRALHIRRLFREGI